MASSLVKPYTHHDKGERMTDLSELRFFATHEHDCGYLPEQQARTIFVDPEAEIDAELYSELSDLGFRRSGPHIYRPHCGACKACIPIRLPVSDFAPTRSQKRCLKRNAALKVRKVDKISSPKHYALYERYINLRHADGDMYPPSFEQYTEFLTKEWNVTEFLEFYDGERLVAVSVIDHLQAGISAIYAFFDPDDTKRSLGVFLIQRAQAMRLPYVYLGYWIKSCQKMRYKVDYRPFQIFVDKQWITVRDYKP